MFPTKILLALQCGIVMFNTTILLALQCGIVVGSEGLIMRNVVRQLIYSTQHEFCGSQFCSVSESYKPPECIDDMFFEHQEFPPCNPCSCSDRCQVVGDCCADKHIGSRYFFECESVKVYKPPDGVLPRRGLMVKACTRDAPNYGEELAEKCQQVDVGLTEDGRIVKADMENTTVIFRNKHCAECYDITNISPMDVYITCIENPVPTNFPDMNTFLRSVQETPGCMMADANEEFSDSKYCLYDDVISTCNVTGKWLEYNESVQIACLTYLNPLDVMSLPIYRNIFCATCNGVTEAQYRCPMPFLRTAVTRAYHFPFVAIVNFDKSDVEVLTDIDEFPIVRVGRQDRHQCRTGDVYDSLFGRCREIYCPLAQDGDDDSSCFHLLSPTDKVAIIWKITILFDDLVINSSEPYAGDVGLRASQSLQDFVSGLDLKIIEYSSTKIVRPLSPDALRVEMSKLDLGLIPLSDMNLQTAKDRLQRVESFNWVMPWLGNTIKIQVGIGHEVEVNEDMFSLPRVNATFDTSYTTRVPVEFNMACRMIKYDINEVYDDKKPLELASKYHFVRNDNVYVCIEMMFQIQSFNSALERAVLQLVCLVCSIFFLLLTLFAIIGLKLISNVPGFNLAFLCITLLLGQSLFLLRTWMSESKVSCTAIGAFTHYFWLAALVWMNISCLHMYRLRNFAEDDKGKRRMLLYVALSIFLSSVIVSATIATSYVLSEYGSFGYSDICFVEHGYTSWISLGVPVSITLLTNTVVSILHTVRNRRATDQTDKGNNPGVDICLFFTLSTLTFVSWLLYFIGAHFQNVECMYVFNCLQACHGVLVFLSFVCNPRYTRSIRARLCCAKEDTDVSSEKSKEVTENTGDRTVQVSTISE